MQNILLNYTIIDRSLRDTSYKNPKTCNFLVCIALESLVFLKIIRLLFLLKL